MTVPTTHVVAALADFLAAQVPVTHGYGANEAPEILPGVLDIDRMYGIVYPVDLDNFRQFLVDPALASFLFQVTLVAGTRRQADTLGDRVGQVLANGQVPDVVSDVGAWAKTVSFMDIRPDGITFSSSPGEHLHTLDARFVAELTLT